VKICRVKKRFWEREENSEIRANIRIAFKMFGERVASLVKFFYIKQKKILQSAEKPRY